MADRSGGLQGVLPDGAGVQPHACSLPPKARGAPRSDYKLTGRFVTVQRALGDRGRSVCTRLLNVPLIYQGACVDYKKIDTMCVLVFSGHCNYLSVLMVI